MIPPDNTLWDVPPAAVALPPEEVHVWRIRLDRPADEVARLHETLAADERARAARFHFAEHRRRFTVARGRLRAVLAGYLGCRPEQVGFRYGPHGKPELAADAGELRFNLAHSDEGALLGVTRGRDVGVDLERVRTVKDLEQLARRYFAAAEVADLEALPAAERAWAFFRCWTGKEAYIKAIGLGLACPLESFRVALRPGEPPSILEVDGSAAGAAQWAVREFLPWAGFVGRATVRGHEWRLRCWEGTPPTGDSTPSMSG
jgi:4'-phosphopantetheinyl transferase